MNSQSPAFRIMQRFCKSTILLSARARPLYRFPTIRLFTNSSDSSNSSGSKDSNIPGFSSSTTETAKSSTPQTQETSGNPEEKNTNENYEHDNSEHVGSSTGSSERASNFWPSLFLGGSVALAVFGYNEYIRMKAEEKSKLHKSTAVGDLKIGGSFTLTNQFGERFSEKDLHGKFVLMYFGFAHCPDFCPTEMKKLTNVVNRIEKKFGDVILPVFVSVDPVRDTPEALQKYSAPYHDKFIYLTGTPEEILQMAKKFRVYFSKPDPTDPHYQIDHSLYSFFLGKEGESLDIFSNSKTEDEVVEMVSAAIQK